MRILLVEDERDMASWLMRALAQSGFVPDHAADARSAEAFMAGNEYDAIVMDLRLPDKHGGGVARNAQPRRPHAGAAIDRPGRAAGPRAA